MIKIFAGIVLGVFCFFVILAIVGSRSIQKENELAKSGIESEIAISKTIEEYAQMSQEERTSICFGKHMEITGTVDKITGLYIRFNTDRFDLVCYIDNARALGIDRNMIVTLDGVCTYNAADNMRLRLCTVTNIDANMKPEPATEEKKEDINKEKNSFEESATQQTSEEAISADTDMDIVTEVLENHNDTRKVEHIESVHNGMLQKDNQWTMFSVFSINESLYGCSKELNARQEQLIERIGTVSDTGVLVYFEGSAAPDYYVDLETKKLYDIYMVKDGTVVNYLLAADDPAIKDDICNFYYDAINELRQQIAKYECEVQGTVVENDLKYRYLILYGTARNAAGEKFEGYIRLNYSKKEEEEYELVPDPISVTAYRLEPDDGRSFEYNGQRCLFLETDSVYTYVKETALAAERGVMILSPNAEWQ